MSVKVKLVSNLIPRILAALPRETNALVRKTTLGIERTAKASLSGEKSGRIYPRGGTYHQASAPGEAPATDMDKLAGGIGSEFPSPGRGIVFSVAEYSAPLEFGSEHILPRPFMTPAAEKQRQEFLDGVHQLASRLGK